MIVDSARLKKRVAVRLKRNSASVKTFFTDS
jgi:hypothetical protein